MISVCFQGKPFNITVIQAYALTSNTEEAEVEWFYEDLQDFLFYFYFFENEITLYLFRSSFFFSFLFVVNFVIHWNETAMGLHVFPIPIPPPTSLSTRSP